MKPFSPVSLVVWIGGLGSALLVGLAVTLGLWVLQHGPWTGLWGIVYVDAFGALMLTLITFVGLIAMFYSATYMRHEVEKGQLTDSHVLTYFGWSYLFGATMVAAVVVENLGFLWVAIEASTLVSAFLVGFYNRRNSLEAAWKYVILCSVGIAFALLGLVLLYTAGVQAGLDPAQALNWTHLMAAAPKLNPAYVRMAFALALVGFGTKAGLAPMHSWVPDAYSQAPLPTAVLSGVLLNTALYAILRFHAVAVRTLGPGFSSHLLLAFGLISLGLAALFILVQKDFRRLLGYSSVEHMGLICIGVGLGGPVGLTGAVLHMVGSTLAKSLLFFTAGNVGHRYHTFRMERIRGAVRALPVSGPLLIVGTLALTGMPPTSVFLSEFSIVAAGFKSGQVWAVVLLLLGIALAFAGMLLHLREMALGEVPHGIETGERASWASVPLWLPLALVVLLGVWIPPALSEAIRQIAGVLGGGL